MSAGSGTTRHLHVQSRFPFEQPVFLEQLPADLDEPFGGIVAMEGDPDAVETPPQAVVVEARAEEVTIDRTQHFVDAITENKTTIFDRHACFGTGHEGAAHVNDIFGFHVRWNGEERCAIAPNRARMAKSGLGASGRVLATAGAEHRGESGRRIGKRSGEGPVGAHRAAELHRRRAATGGAQKEIGKAITEAHRAGERPYARGRLTLPSALVIV